MAVTFKPASELVDGDLIELRDLPFRYTSDAVGYRSADGDHLVRVGSEYGPHTPIGDNRLTLHTDHGDWDVSADLDFVLMGHR